MPHLFAEWLKEGWHEQTQPEVSEATCRCKTKQKASATDSFRTDTLNGSRNRER